MVAAESKRASEGKRMASDRSRSGLRQGLGRCATQDTRVQVRRRKGRSKKKGVFGLKQDNVATFQRGNFPTSRR